METLRFDDRAALLNVLDGSWPGSDTKDNTPISMLLVDGESLENPQLRDMLANHPALVDTARICCYKLNSSGDPFPFSELREFKRLAKPIGPLELLHLLQEEFGALEDSRPASPHPSPIALAGRKLRILVAEDNKTIKWWSSGFWRYEATRCFLPITVWRLLRNSTAETSMSSSATSRCPS